MGWFPRCTTLRDTTAERGVAVPLAGVAELVGAVASALVPRGDCLVRRGVAGPVFPSWLARLPLRDSTTFPRGVEDCDTARRLLTLAGVAVSVAVPSFLGGGA